LLIYIRNLQTSKSPNKSQAQDTRLLRSDVVKVEHSFLQADVFFCIVLYSSIYIAPLNSHGQTEALQEKIQVLRSDKDEVRLDDKTEARAEGGRRFQREGPITEKDLDMSTVVLVRRNTENSG